MKSAITIKTPEDIEILKEGGKRHAYILKELVTATIAGVSTKALNTLAERLIAEGDDDAAFLNYRPEGARRPYPASLIVSINEEIVHGIPNEEPKIVQEGDVVTLDLGLTHKGLITDAAITVGIGKITEEEKMLIRATRECLEAGVKAACGGGHIGDIGAAVEAVAKKYDLAIAEGLAGHGVGYKVHEDPFVPNMGHKGEGEVLVPGMVIAIEPMLCLGTGAIRLLKDGYTFVTRDGKKAAHFEHTVVITEGLPIVLTA